MHLDDAGRASTTSRVYADDSRAGGRRRGRSHGWVSQVRNGLPAGRPTAAFTRASEHPNRDQHHRRGRQAAPTGTVCAPEMDLAGTGRRLNRRTGSPPRPHPALLVGCPGRWAASGAEPPWPTSACRFRALAAVWSLDPDAAPSGGRCRAAARPATSHPARADTVLADERHRRPGHRDRALYPSHGSRMPALSPAATYCREATVHHGPRLPVMTERGGTGWRDPRGRGQFHRQPDQPRRAGGRRVRDARRDPPRDDQPRWRRRPDHP